MQHTSLKRSQTRTNGTYAPTSVIWPSIGFHYLIIALQDTNGDTSWNCGALASALGTTSYIGRGREPERYDTRTTTSEWVGQLS